MRQRSGRRGHASLESAGDKLFAREEVCPPAGLEFQAFWLRLRTGSRSACKEG